MKTKVSALVLCLSLMGLTGCSLKDGGWGNGPSSPNDWERLAPTIQQRVKYVAAFAFNMDAIKPHRQSVCAFADQLSMFLNTYDDRDASFEKLQSTVNDFISQIPDPNVRNAVSIISDIALTEAFNYAWQHYEGFIEQDQARVAIIIAKAVANGLRDACGMTLSVMAIDDEAPEDIFTVRGG